MTMQKEIHLHYYAQIRAGRGCSRESVRTMAENPRDLFGELGLDRIVPLDHRSVKVAINDEFASWDAALEHGDVVVFMTPVAGG
jgi:sulfur-carrier protein